MTDNKPGKDNSSQVKQDDKQSSIITPFFEASDQLLERADSYFRRVKDDPRLDPSLRGDLDYGLMLLLHHRTMLFEEETKRKAKSEITVKGISRDQQIEALQKFQKFLFHHWDELERMPTSSKYHFQSVETVEYALIYHVTAMLKEAYLYDIASCIFSLKRIGEMHATPEAKRTYYQTIFEDINKIVVERLQLPALQVPYYKW